MLAQLLVVIDVSIVTLAPSAIQRALHFSPLGLPLRLTELGPRPGRLLAGPLSGPRV